MKRFVFAILTVAIIFSLCSCSVKEEDIKTTENVRVSNPLVAKNNDEALDSEKFNDVIFSKKSEYTYKGNSFSLSSPYFDEEDFSSDIHSYFDVTINKLSNEKKSYIGYKVFDGNGEIIRESFICFDISGCKEGDVIYKQRVSFPFKAVKVEFFDYE